MRNDALTSIRPAASLGSDRRANRSQLVEGPQFVGESRQAVKEVVASIVEGYEEALIEDELPRKYFDVQKHYFGEIENLTEAEDAPAGKADESEEKSDDSGE